MGTDSPSTTDQDSPEDILGPMESFLIKFLALLIPLQVWFTHTYYDDSPYTFALSALVVVLLVSTFLLKTNPGEPGASRTRYFSHGLTRAIYGAIGLSVAAWYLYFLVQNPIPALLVFAGIGILFILILGPGSLKLVRHRL